MFNALCSMIFMLAQNEKEKSLTVLGLTLFGGFIFILILDSIVKNNWVPKSDILRRFLIFIFVLVIIAVSMLIIFYK